MRLILLLNSLVMLLSRPSLAMASCSTPLRGGGAARRFENVIKINTSNSGKRAEFERAVLAAGRKAEFTSRDLREVDADDLTVIVHKASQFGPKDRVVVEDTSLWVEGADVGINVRWLLQNLDRHKGKRARWTVNLAYRVDSSIYVYQVELSGRIVEARGDGFGFDPVFLPDGETKTLAESKPDQFNLRATALRKMMAGENPQFVRDVIVDWTGPWQESDHP